MAYVLPRKTEKQLLFDMKRETIQSICDRMPLLDKEKYLCDEIGGITLSMAREAIASGDAAEWFFHASSDRPEPYIIFDANGNVGDVSAVKSLRPCSCADGFSEALDMFYGEKSRSDNIRALKSNMQRVFLNAKKRTEKRLAEQKTELEAARGRDALKQKADLITANIGIIRSGEKKVKVTDYFDPDMPEKVIELDETLSPQQNAQKLYRKYARLKNAEIHLNEQISKGEEELGYINSLLFSLDIAEKSSEIDLVRAEAKTGGFLKNDHKKERNLPASPRKFKTKNGFELLCGRNNTENDNLTHRLASKKDIWFHARGAAGSHVVLLCRDGAEVTDEDIEEAAGLAAFFSADKNDRVPVDYTLIKNVKKPSGGRPGEVNYFDYKSVYVKPVLPAEEK
jgi:predicted ribosome quality control (RQC) complex YloA/Tae2 family protein